MRYNIYINNFLDYSEYRMSNDFRIIIDDFNQLRICYVDDRPSKVLSTDKKVVNRFKRKVLKRITEYVEHLQQNI